MAGRSLARSFGNLRQTKIHHRLMTTMNLVTIPEILSELNNGVLRITVNRPEKANAFSLPMYDTLGQLVKQAEQDESVRLVVLTGAGKFFTAGNELTNFGSTPKEMSNVVRDFVSSLIDLTKPLLALVNGPAIGIGATILPHCDAVYAARSAYFSTPFTSLGICPEACSSYLFPKIMGIAKANEMLMLNAKLTAEEAFNCGFISRVFPDETFQVDTVEIVERTARIPYKALLTSKELIRGPYRHKLHTISTIEFDKIAELTSGEECHNAVREFFEKKSKK